MTKKALDIISHGLDRPAFICIVGSMSKFPDEILTANRLLTMWGALTLVPPLPSKGAEAPNAREAETVKNLGFTKVDLCDGLYVVNPGGYVGEDTAELMAYAIYTKTPITFLDMPRGESWLETQRHVLGGMLGRFMLDGPPHRRKSKEEKPKGIKSHGFPLGVILDIIKLAGRGNAATATIADDLADVCTDPDCLIHGERNRAKDKDGKTPAQ